MVDENSGPTETERLLTPGEDLHIPPLFEPSIKYWYAVYVQVNHEKTVANQLDLKSIECYLPLLKKWSKRQDRRKKIFTPIFPGYLFVHEKLTNPAQVEILKVPGAVYILKGTQGPLPIPDWQIQALQTVLRTSESLQPHSYMNKGDWVRVVKGPLQGCTGILVRHKPKQGRLVVNVDVIRQSVSVELNVEDVEPLKPVKLEG